MCRLALHEARLGNTEVIEDLKKGTDNWNKVVSYVEANKTMGLEKIIQQIERKYNLTPAVKKEINKNQAAKTVELPKKRNSNNKDKSKLF